MEILVEVGAIDNGEITPLGRHLAALPVDVHIGKTILFGSIFSCIDPILTIAASISFRSPFIVSIENKEETTAARLSFAAGYSDHLTVYKAYKGWKEAKKQGKKQEAAFLKKNWLSRAALYTIEDMKREFFSLLMSVGFISKQSKMDDVDTSRSNVSIDKYIGDYIEDQCFFCSPHNVWATEETLISNIIPSNSQLSLITH
jgi:HrpA-like RNA helicase